MAKLKSEADQETDRLIGLCLGAGMSVEKTAEHVGIVPNTVRKHIDGNRQFIFKVKAEVEAIFAKTMAHEIEDLEAKYQRIRPKAWKKLEDLIESDKEGVALGAVNSALDRMDGKAVNRLLTVGSVEHTHSLSPETLDRLEALERKFLPAPPKALPIIDV